MNLNKRDLEYYSKRQKNNESSRISRLKRKKDELEVAMKKVELERTCIHLQRELSYISQHG